MSETSEILQEQYPDLNGNGVPDAFENRPSIVEILNADEIAARAEIEQAIRELEAEADNSLTVELDLRLRPPLEGEMYLFIDRVMTAAYDHGKYPSSSPSLIIKRIVSAPSWWKPESDL
jgi:hypothetical protein